MLPHNIKAYTAILNEMPESEINHRLVLAFFGPREKNLALQALCREVLSRRFGENMFEWYLLRASMDLDEQEAQRKRLGYIGGAS